MIRALLALALISAPIDDRPRGGGSAVGFDGTFSTDADLDGYKLYVDRDGDPNTYCWTTGADTVVCVCGGVDALTMSGTQAEFGVPIVHGEFFTMQSGGSLWFEEDVSLWFGNSELEMHYDSGDSRTEINSAGGDPLRIDAPLIQVDTFTISSPGSVWHDDDVAEWYGDNGDFEIHYDNTSTRFEFNSTDCDGVSGDCNICVVEDGTDDLVCGGDLTITNVHLGAAARSKITSSADNYIEMTDAGGEGIRFNFNADGQVTLTAEDAANLLLNIHSMESGGSWNLVDSASLKLGTGEDSIIEWRTAQTPDTLMWRVGTDSRAILIIESGDQATAFNRPQQDNPTIFIQSSDATSTNDYVGIAHDQTDVYFQVGAGGYKFEDDGGKGVATVIRTNTESVTFAGNPGDASKTTTGGVIPMGFLLGISTRVTTAGTNCAGFHIGNGVDDNLWGDDIAVAQNTTTDEQDYTATFSPIIWGSAGEVTITGTNGAGVPTNCYDMVVEITSHYFDLLPQQSN